MCISECYLMLIMSPPEGSGDIVFPVRPSVRPSVCRSSVCLSVRHKSCPLYNSKTIRDISMKLGTLIKHNRMMCHDGQNHNSCLHILG